MERETGIEPATNSLEGCDSTTELLPPTRLSRFAFRRLRRAGPPLYAALPLRFSRRLRRARQRKALSTRRRCGEVFCPPNFQTSCLALHAQPAPDNWARSWWGGEGSNLRSPKAAGLQPAAIDHSATSPKRSEGSRPDTGNRRRFARLLMPEKFTATSALFGIPRFDTSLQKRRGGPWSWRRDSNPRPPDYKSGALPD